MKNLKLFLVFMTLSLFLIFTACSREVEKVEGNSIVGTWTFSEATADVIESNNPEYNSIIGTFVAERGRKDNNNSFFVFAEDGTVTSGFSDEVGTYIASYTFKNDVLTFIDEEFTVNVPASVDGNKLYIYADYADHFNDLGLDELIKLGIGDPSTRAEKAIVKLTYTK